MCKKLDNPTSYWGSMEEEGGNGCSDHVLHNTGVESPDGTCTTLNQSLLTQSLLGDLGDVLLPAQF